MSKIAKYMINFPNKFTSVPDSVIGHMLKLYEQIPANGICLDILIKRAIQYMDLDEFIGAVTCLYAINKIYLKDNKIFNKEI